MNKQIFLILLRINIWVDKEGASFIYPEKELISNLITRVIKGLTFKGHLV